MLDIQRWIRHFLLPYSGTSHFGERRLKYKLTTKVGCLQKQKDAQSAEVKNEMIYGGAWATGVGSLLTRTLLNGSCGGPQGNMPPDVQAPPWQLRTWPLEHEQPWHKYLHIGLASCQAWALMPCKKLELRLLSEGRPWGEQPWRMGAVLVFQPHLNS